MNTDFTHEEANFLRVATAFVVVHQQQQQLSQKRPCRPPILPSRTSRCAISYENHIQHMIQLTQRETVGSLKWKSLVQHLAQQLVQWDQTPQWLATNLDAAVWHELLQMNAAFFAPLMVPLLLPQQQKNGHVWQLLEVALERAPLCVVEETVQELIQAPPLHDLAVYYLNVSDGSDLLSKWAQDNLLQQLLERLHEAEHKSRRIIL